MKSRVQWGSGLARQERERKEKAPPKPPKKVVPDPATMLSGSLWRVTRNLRPIVFGKQGTEFRLLSQWEETIGVDLLINSMVTYMCTRKERRTMILKDRSGKERAAVNYVTEHFFLHGGNVWFVTDNTLVEAFKQVE